MKRLTGILTQITLWGMGSIAIFGGVIPPKVLVWLVPILAALSAFTSAATSNKNPDGTPAQTAWIPPLE